MATVVVSSNLTHRHLALRAVLTHDLAVHIGNAFTSHYTDDCTVHAFLRSIFGAKQSRWFCIDMTELIAVITFSDAPNPKVLHFRGHGAQIARSDADQFELRIQQVDLIKPTKPTKVMTDSLIRV